MDSAPHIFYWAVEYMAGSVPNAKNPQVESLDESPAAVFGP